MKSVLETTEWARLVHAYGPAVDTPTHLRALLSGDEAAQKAAVSHLWSSILHQGTPASATAPAARVVGRIVGEVIPELRPVLLLFLAEVGRVLANCGASLDEIKAEDPGYAAAIHECVQIAPELLATALPHLSSDDKRARIMAAHAAARLGTAAGNATAPELEGPLAAAARDATDNDERSAIVLSLGEVGGSTREFLADSSRAVSVCAALAPALATDEAALAELIAALEDAEHLDAWFRVRPPQIAMWPRFVVVARLVSSVRDFERLADGAVAIARITDLASAGWDWGRLLVAAFRGDGVVRTPGQRRYLSALVANEKLWSPKAGGPRQWFRKAGLTYDLAACEGLVR